MEVQAPAEAQAAPAQEQQGQMPSLDDVINSFNSNDDGITTQSQNPEQPTQNQEEAIENKEAAPDQNLEQFEALKKQELELFRAKKEMREEREAFKREREEYSSNHDNFEDTLSDLLATPEEKEAREQEENKFDPEAYKAQLREEILGEVNDQRTSEREEQETQGVIDNYINEAKTFTKERGGDFPMLEGLGKHDMVYDVIQATYDENAKLYGHEKAAEMIPTMEQAALHVEKNLANEIEQVLKSDLVRGHIQKILGMKPTSQEDNNQSNQAHQSKSNQNTLTNSGFTQHSAGLSENVNMTDEDAFDQALSLVVKN